MNSADIEKLCRAEAFRHSSDDLSLRETHISWVILCGNYAYKIKKPVNFGFVDFSTLERRRHFCEEELRLNSRFSPELYLAVVPITAGDRGPVVDGPGATIDYAVLMRRFDESQLLDNIARRDGLDLPLLRELGRELARLHAALPSCYPDPAGSGPGTPAAIRAALAQNFENLRKYPLQDLESRELDAIEQWTTARYDALLPAMRRRVRDGWVIDGHGDAHLGNIAIIDGAVRLFDCIEFNAAFRIIDSIGEIALLSMDLRERGHPAESRRLLMDYLEYRGDYGGLAMLDFYRIYYALVRAKVNLLREPADRPDLADTEAYAEMRRYIALAQAYCQPRRRFIAITHGVSGSGKTTLAGKLAEACGAVRIRSDVERKRLFGLAPEQHSRAEVAAQLYSAATTARTFQRLRELAEVTVEAGFAAVVDGTFLHRDVREDFRRLAERLQVPFAILDCIAEPAEIRRRLDARARGKADASEADAVVMEQQLEQLEPLDGEELALRVMMDSAEEAEVLGAALYRKLAG